MAKRKFEMTKRQSNEDLGKATKKPKLDEKYENYINKINIFPGMLQFYFNIYIYIYKYCTNIYIYI